MVETVAVACDHAGLKLKNKISNLLEQMGCVVIDLGTNDEESVDYPDYADKLAESMRSYEVNKGVLICGSGIGISIAANRHSHIRAALCHNEEITQLARQHNNANVLVLGARMIDEATALACVKSFFNTEYEGGRHDRRVGKLS